MSRLIVLGATGSLGGHVLQQATAAGHEVTAMVRTPSRIPQAIRGRVAVQVGDLRTLPAEDLAGIVRAHDALVCCAGVVTEGETFVHLVDRVVTGIERLAVEERPACWFMAGAALLDLDPSGRRGVDLPPVAAQYWPHRLNYERLLRSSLNWRLLCPGPMTASAAHGLDRLRVSLDRLPVELPQIGTTTAEFRVLRELARVMPEMIVPYADAAALMVAHLHPEDPMVHHRVGLALPVGMRGEKPSWAGPAGAALEPGSRP